MDTHVVLKMARASFVHDFVSDAFHSVGIGVVHGLLFLVGWSSWLKLPLLSWSNSVAVASELGISLSTNKVISWGAVDTRCLLDECLGLLLGSCFFLLVADFKELLKELSSITVDLSLDLINLNLVSLVNFKLLLLKFVQLGCIWASFLSFGKKVLPVVLSLGDLGEFLLDLVSLACWVGVDSPLWN
jgi:hypothetical protein